MAVQVQGNALFIPAIQSNFWGVYQTLQKDADARLAPVMGEFQSSRSAESYGYATTAPVMRRWDEGGAIPTDAFLSRAFYCRNYKWGVAVPISRVTIADDQLKLVVARAKEVAGTSGLLKERIFYQLLTNGSVPDNNQLLPAIPLCPDGVALYSATDGGGAARFGRTGGNLNSPGAGQLSAAAVIQDVFTDLQIFAAFQNTQGQPLFPSDSIMKKLLAFHNPAYVGSWTAAINQLFNVSSSGNAAPSNVIIDANMKLANVASAKITNNYSYMFATEIENKAIFWQIREPMTEMYANEGNSDRSREFDENKWYARMRAGAAYGLPYNTVRNG
jgi:hypothetical protein